VCHFGKELPAYYPISQEEAERKGCCIELPCSFEAGCWAGLKPPLYSAPRSQALSEDQAHTIEDDLLLPLIHSGALKKTNVPSMPNHSWYRISASKEKYPFLYEGIQTSFLNTFQEELRTSAVDLDIFYIDDFDEHWASNETYQSLHPGAGYWIHNDCQNFRVCHEETGFAGKDFTGDGVAFVLPLALPSEVNYRDGNDMMPAALELYNISNGYRDDSGPLLRPQNRHWASVHRYNLGEIIYFNAFRWHSGHVPMAGNIPLNLNPLRKRAEAIGFAAKHKDGYWVLFRMCKGSTDDKVTKKILETDLNPTSTGEAKSRYDLTEEEFKLHQAGLNYEGAFLKSGAVFTEL